MGKGFDTMTTNNKGFILSAAIGGWGYHPGAPRGQAGRFVDVAYYRQLVQSAERGLLDFVLLPDARAFDGSRPQLDALTLLARLALETRFVGLAVSKPTSYSEPFTVSRELATLDWLSGGRAAWHVSTSGSDAEAQNFGQARALSAFERRERATEFVAVSRKLWDSWEDDAVIVDRTRGWYLDGHKLHHIDHIGSHFQIRGPQITYRPPQGHVVVLQIDDGDAGALPSAEVADLLILHHETLADAQHAYAHHQQRAAQTGREVRVLHAILPILGTSEVLAQMRADELNRVAPPNAPPPHAKQLVGTPEQVADELEHWFATGAADGFHLLPPVLPDGLNELVDQLIPVLQKRGLFRSAYSGRTLREHVRLPRPISQYAGTPSEAHTAYEEH